MGESSLLLSPVFYDCKQYSFGYIIYVMSNNDEYGRKPRLGDVMKSRKKLGRSIMDMGLRQKTVALAMMFFAVVVVLSSATFFTIYENMRIETTKKAVESLTAQKKEEVESYFDNLESLAYSIGFSSWMQTLFQPKSLDTRTMQEVSENIEYFLGTISGMNEGVRLAAIMDSGERLQGTSPFHLDYSVHLERKSWYPVFLYNGKYIEEGEGKGLYTKGQGWYMNIYYPINNQYSLEQEGILAVTLPVQNILRFTDMGAKGEYMTIKNSSGKVIASSLPEKISEEIEKRPSYYSKRTAEIDIGGEFWTVEVILDTSGLAVDSRNIWLGFGAALLLAAVFFLLASVMFSRYLTVPILECRDAMTKIRNNQMGITMENHYHDEIGELIDGFNEMSCSICDLIEKNRVISTLQKETEYQMLLQQINPHFLYNTLEIINGLILSHEEESAVSICENLGSMFHYNLKQEKWISVKEEMAYIRQYLLIMKYKIPGLSVFCQTEEDVEKKKILKAVLQPLVENCIRHGFAQKTEECCISISIENQDGKMCISIMDNGRGISREKYISLVKELQDIRDNPNQRKESSAHIGIWNVFHRLYLEYGDAMDFQIISKENAGTRIQMVLPGEDEHD